MRLIPQAAPQLRFARFRREVDEAIARVLEGSTYILGDAVARFEQAFAHYSGRAYCVGVASGTDALALALRALGIGPGQEVIVPALTFVGSAQAVLHCGAAPRLVDVDATTRCIDPDAVEAAIGHKTAAIIPVHLFGHPCDMPRLAAIAERHNLALLEDCAQSHGATLAGRPLGTFGQAGAYSFYPTKNLGCLGDGGAIVTNDEMLAIRLRRLRNYGFAEGERVSGGIGFNSRLDEIQAAVLEALLPRLDAANQERRAAAASYRMCLRNDPDVTLPPDDPGSVYHQFAVEHRERERFAAFLRDAGLNSAVHYTPGLHRHPFFGGAQTGAFPVTDRLASRLLSLPIQPELAPDAVRRLEDAMCHTAIAHG